MANNLKMSKSASVEDLREKHSPLEVEVEKLVSEMQEVLKGQVESSRRQEENQLRIEEVSRSLENKIGSLGLMMERTIKQLNGKSPNWCAGESSNVHRDDRPNGDGNSRIHGNRNDKDEMDPDYELNSEELQWTVNHMKGRERVIRPDNRRNGSYFQLPRMEFLHFDRGDSLLWKLNCEFYFEMYKVPEIYKTRMAVMNFSEEIHEWYRCLIRGSHQLSWDLLVEEVNSRFQSLNLKHPVDEFKRTHQTRKVEEFIKRFDRVKARLLRKKPNFDEEFFVAGFISGLKEEVRSTVELFNPRRLNNAFQSAMKVENAQEAQNKKPKELSRNFKYQKPINSSFKQKVN